MSTGSPVNLFGGAVVGYGGPRVQADGQPGTLRITKDGTECTQDAHGRYQEAVYRGNVFLAASQAAVTFSAGLTTTTCVGLLLENPPGNTKNAVILQASFANTGTIVGTAGLVAFPFSTTAFTHTTALTILNAFTGTGKQAATCTADQGSSSTPTTPVVVTPLYTILSTNTAVSGTPCFVDLGGSLIVGPGTAVGILASAAITGFASMLWEEVPI